MATNKPESPIAEVLADSKLGAGEATPHPREDLKSSSADTQLSGEKPSEATPSDGEEEEAVVKLNRKQLAIMTVAMAFAIFLIALDETIISTAIPRITDQFHSLNDVGWYGSAYMLTMCCFQLHYGKLYQHFSTKIIFITSIALFELGSLICAVSPNSPALIVGRAVAGSGASGVVSGVLIIIAKAVPLRERSIYTAAVGSVYGIASIIGPLLGGVITDSRLTWRWCFYINLPIGGFVVVVIGLLYRPPKTKSSQQDITITQKLKMLDPIGLFLFVPAMVCLILALQLSGGDSSWSSPQVIALLTLFGIFIISFIAVQIWLQEGATLPPRIAKKRTVAFAAFYAMCLDGAYYTLTYYFPIWFQAIQGTTAASSGIHLLPLILGAFITTILAGVIVSTYGFHIPFIVAATILTTIGCGLLTTLDVHAGPAKWIGYQALAGIGVGLGMQQAVIAVQNVLSPEDMPIGTAVIAFFQTLGPAIMVSVAQNVFDQRLTAGLGANAPGVSTSSILVSGATNVTRVVKPAELPLVLVDINNALTQTWYVAVAVAALSGIGACGMEWKGLRKT